MLFVTIMGRLSDVWMGPGEVIDCGRLRTIFSLDWYIDTEAHRNGCDIFL